MGRIVGEPRDDDSLIDLIDFVDLFDDLRRYLSIGLEVELLSPVDSREVDEVEVVFIGEGDCQLGSLLLLVALDADNRSFVPFLNESDQELDGVVWPFEEHFPGEFAEDCPQLVLYDVLLGHLVPLQGLLFVHCSYINNIDLRNIRLGGNSPT